MLKKKTTQLGGKGTSRRKIKRKTKKIVKKGDDSIKFKNKIENINKKILALNLGNYIKLRDFLDGLIKDYVKDIKRSDINKKHGLKYTEINTQGAAFIYKHFFYPVNEDKILLKSNIYEYVNKNFKISGKMLFFNFLDAIDNILVKKEYKVDLESDKYKQDEFNKALNFFKISPENKVHFKDIREQYEIKLNKEDITDLEKKDINTYYLILRNQYDEYLKSF